MKRIRRYFYIFKTVLLYWGCCVLSILFKRDHWIICERGTDARDNGYWFYRYVKENHKEQKVYYFIDNTSADYEKVKDDAVQPGTLKAIWLLASAKKLISTHYASGFAKLDARVFQLCGLNTKFYFLQHGITKDDLPVLYACNAPMRLFICGAKPEYEYVKTHFGHPEEVVQYTGFARFDHLHNSVTKQQILVMPTWRKYIKTREDFLESDYYKNWSCFLSDPQVNKILEKSKLKIVFYLHYEMQKYADCFKNLQPNIIVATFEDYDVQTLLKESKLLITDYSSVFFDFAYMQKPVIYYQFDKNTFRSHHYQRGYFEYSTLGFGDVCTEAHEVIECLNKIIVNKMRLEEEYANRIKMFFPLYDTQNAERIYDLIVKN